MISSSITDPTALNLTQSCRVTSVSYYLKVCSYGNTTNVLLNKLTASRVLVYTSGALVFGEVFFFFSIYRYYPVCSLNIRQLYLYFSETDTHFCIYLRQCR